MWVHRVVGTQGAVVVVVLGGVFTVLFGIAVAMCGGSGGHVGVLLQVFQASSHGQKACALGLAQHRLRQVLRPRLQRHGVAQAVPVGQLIHGQAQQMLQRRRLGKAKASVEHHGHHFGGQFHHLHQKRHLVALFGQALAQHVVAFGVRHQIVQLGLVGRAQVIKIRRKFHRAEG